MDYAGFAEAHALWVIAFVLVAAPLGAALAWSAFVRVLDTREPPTQRTLVVFAALVPLACGVMVFAAIATRVERGEAFSSADQLLLDSIRKGVPPLAAQSFARLTHLGDPLFLALLCALVCVALAWKRHFGLALFLIATTSLGGLLNRVLKLSMHRERPIGALVPLPESYSFPSGHSFGSMVCYGMCAYVLMRVASRGGDALIVASTCLLVLLIGTSRVVIGVHFLTDVAGGFASGGAWLAFCIGLAELARRVPASGMRTR
ncbi:phosphatase PAP2 family protein [Caballeronia sp. GAFFF2]|uniref:phosphatase PAP2 family protein n=1 Tax=Caballeronia sp. GAFFF2 TaxID=2921741 RepID=UPI0020280530|nr:phosphatase PAP2 family protein [Caballeronia sp. GAFFF2]